MSNVKHIKQRAIEIANNSLSEIIIGVINHKDEPVVMSSYGELDEFLGFDINFYNDNDMPQVLRVSCGREERLEQRRQRRRERLSKY